MRFLLNFCLLFYRCSLLSLGFLFFIPFASDFFCFLFLFYRLRFWFLCCFGFSLCLRLFLYYRLNFLKRFDNCFCRWNFFICLYFSLNFIIQFSFLTFKFFASVFLLFVIFPSFNFLNGCLCGIFNGYFNGRL